MRGGSSTSRVGFGIVGAEKASTQPELSSSRFDFGVRGIRHALFIVARNKGVAALFMVYSCFCGNGDDSATFRWIVCI